MEFVESLQQRSSDGNVTRRFCTWEGTGLRVQRWLVLRGKNDTSFEIREKSETGGGEHCRDTTLPDRRDALIAMWSRGHFLESAFS